MKVLSIVGDVNRTSIEKPISDRSQFFIFFIVQLLAQKNKKAMTMTSNVTNFQCQLSSTHDTIPKMEIETMWQDRPFVCVFTKASNSM